MPLLFTQHALSRMSERHITESEVQDAINRCVGGPMPGKRGTLEYLGPEVRPGRKKLKVVTDAAVRDRAVTVFEI